MKKFSKVALGAIALTVGAGSVGATSFFRSQPSNLKGADATITQEYAYTDTPNKFGGFSFSDFTDKGSYYLLPNSGNDCLVYKTGILGASGLSIDKSKSVTITINHATYGSGTGPSASTFSFFNNTTGTGAAVTATQTGSLASSKTFTNVIYTISGNTFSGDDICIKVTKPGQQIRLKSFSIQYTKAEVKTVSSLAVTGTLTKTSYYEGDTFDPTGLTVTATYNDSTTAIVTPSVVWSDPVVGQNYVTGTYTSIATVTCQSPTITVSAITLSSIAITTSATKSSYAIGDKLDTAGLVVTGTYNTGKTEDVTSKCTITPANESVLSTAGTITISISYLGKTASYAVTVEAPAHTLKKVTSANQLVVGAQIVIASSESNFSMSETQNENNRGQTETSPSSDSLNLLSSSKAALFTLGIGGASGTFSLSDSSGFLYAAGSGKGSNYLRSEETLDTEGNGSWAITVTSAGVASLTAQGSNTNKYLRYNSTSSLFSCYSSSTTQGDIVLYEQTTYYNAASWAIGFNMALDSTCSNTAPTAISSSTWAAQTTSFGNLGTDEKAILKAIVTSNANDATATKQAISRYDYVMGKAAYSSFADFIGRFPSRSTTPLSPIVGMANGNSYLPYIVLVAGAGAAALFFLARKKKHD